MSKWIKWVLAGVSGLGVLAVVALMVTQRVSDGPIEFLQGGPFRTGEVVETPVADWSFGLDKTTEFELEGFGTSRTAGFVMLDGVAYMTCDLGYMWNRLEGTPRYLLNLIYLFKDWHEKALEDGRALIRIDGRIYKANFVKVDDPALNDALKAELERRAREFFLADLGPAPLKPPNDIWFFRMDPR